MQKYKRILVNSASRLCLRAKAREGLANIEAICDAVIASNMQEEMKDCVFGVKLVS